MKIRVTRVLARVINRNEKPIDASRLLGEIIKID